MKKCLLVSTCLLMLGSCTLNHTLRINGEATNDTFWMTMPFVQKNDLIFVRARIHGEERWFLLDTGAELSFIDKSVIAEKSSRGARSIRDARGVQQTLPLTQVHELEMGGVSFLRTMAGVMDFSNSPFANMDFGGIIGQPIINKCNWIVDFQTQQITMTNLSLPADRRFPLDNDEGGRPWVKLDIDGRKRYFLVDTGAAIAIDLPKRSSLWKRISKRYPLQDASALSFALSSGRSHIERESTVLPAIHLRNNFAVDSCLVRSTPDNQRRIGTQLLSKLGRVGIDNQRRELVIIND